MDQQTLHARSRLIVAAVHFFFLEPWAGPHMPRNRGRKKPKLQDFSRSPATTEELNELAQLMQPDAGPTTIAIIGTALIEHELEVLIRRRFLRRDDETWDSLSSESGPLATLNSKIALGYAFRMYDENMRDDLHVIRRLRNAFAHAKRPVDFDHELILGELRKLKRMTKLTKKCLESPITKGAARMAFGSACLDLSMNLVRKHKNALRISNRRYQKRGLQRLAKALAGVSGPGPSPATTPRHRSGGPSHPAQTTLVGGWLSGPLGVPDSEDSKD